MTNRLKRLWAGFFTALFLVLSVGAASYYALDNQGNNSEWVEHTYRVINQVNTIKQLLINMETGRRGFRCTNDKLFLDPYFKSQPKLGPSIADLKNLVSDNTAQTERVNTLEKHVYSVDSLWKSININTVFDDTLRREVTLAEKIFMDQINLDLAAIYKSEQQLLIKRGTDSKNSIRQSLLTLTLGTLLTLAIIITLIRLIIVEFRNRVAAQELVNEKLIESERVNKIVQESNWLLTGIRQINACLMGNESLKGIIDNCLHQITNYIGLPAGAFYFYNKEAGVLKLMGAKSLPTGVKEEIKPKEGILGYAATSREITVHTNIPADYWKIASATGQMLPDTIICVPLWLNKELKGVIELASLWINVERDIELLKAVADNIAVAVTGVYATEQMQLLLHKLQEQTEELTTQQEELREANEALTNQTEELKASEEELKTQEEELRQLNAELEEKTEAVKAAHYALTQKAKELEQSSNYKSEFLANMSHELRTPLNSVLILANLLKENKTANLTGKQVEYASIIHRAGTDLLNLINDILDLSKIEAGKIEIIIEPIRMADVIQDMEQMFSVLAKERKIHFQVTKSADLPATVTTDKQRLEQVIKNLLSNAFKFTPENGRVALDFMSRNDKMIVSVSDTGIGIPADKQQLIFEAFQQADGTVNRKFGGTGLGLSISKELVKKLGGMMSVRSTPGEGSVFTIMLPIDEVLIEASIPDQAGEGGAVIQNIDIKNVKQQTIIADDRAMIKRGESVILIVEDDIVFARHLKEFANSKSYKTVVAISGDEGLWCARKYKPAAIILDLGLPVINGQNLLKLIKNDKELKHIPVHVISAQDSSSILATHVENFLQKPLRPDDLEQTFSNITTYIHENNKSILIISEHDQAIRDIIAKLPAKDSAGVLYEVVDTPELAKEILTNKKIDCIILDTGDNVNKGIYWLKNIRETIADNIYVITCLEGDISAADEKTLKKYANSIIRKSAKATGRLLDEVELFLHRIKNIPDIQVPETYQQDYDKTLYGKKVLIADDDMRNVFALSALLEQEGMEVLAAENGKEVLEIINDNADVDIALMDIMMPEMDGYKTIEHIRADSRFKNLPILALTAKAMVGDKEKCISAGASDYITKPIDNNKLFSLMRVWLAK